MEAVLLTREQLAKAINLSPKTIYNRTASGDIRAKKIGRSVRYRLDEVLEDIEKISAKKK